MLVVLLCFLRRQAGKAKKGFNIALILFYFIYIDKMLSLSSKTLFLGKLSPEEASVTLIFPLYVNLLVSSLSLFSLSVQGGPGNCSVFHKCD